MARAAAAWFVLAGCVVGSPAGFSSGDAWTVPLVDPLADGRLLVPVYLNGTGPYLFALAPNGSTQLDPEAGAAAHVPQFYGAAVREARLGDLTVSPLAIGWLTPHELDGDGRRILGEIGFASEALVFGVDRARGIAWLRTEGTFRPPSNARVLHTPKGGRYGGGRGADVVTASVGGVDHVLRVDLDCQASTLQRSFWSGSKLARAAAADGDALATAEVRIEDLTQSGVRFAPNDEFRGTVDGTLGFGFFTPFTVAIDRHREVIYLSPRADALATRAQRLARWGPRFASCRQLGCVDVHVIGTQLRVVPETPDRDVEVVLRATTPSGVPLPDLQLDLPQGSVAFTTALDERYRDAAVAVIDASPFPRVCAHAHECAAPMAAPPIPPLPAVK